MESLSLPPPISKRCCGGDVGGVNTHFPRGPGRNIWLPSTHDDAGSSSVSSTLPKTLELFLSSLEPDCDSEFKASKLSVEPFPFLNIFLKNEVNPFLFLLSLFVLLARLSVFSGNDPGSSTPQGAVVSWTFFTGASCWGVMVTLVFPTIVPGLMAVSDWLTTFLGDIT